MKAATHMDKPLRVLATGWYGAGNAGDELLLQMLIRYCEEAGARVSVLSTFPSHTQRVHGVDAVDAFDFRAVAKCMDEADLFVLGGGGLFQTHHELAASGLYDYAHGDITSYARPVLMARQMDVPALLWAQGVGPLDSSEARDIVRDVFAGAAYSSVRDQHSAALLREIGVEREIPVAPDPVWALPVESGKLPADDGRQRLGLVVRDWEFAPGWQDALVDAIRHAISPAGQRLVWIPFQLGDEDWSNSDERLVDALMARLGEYEHEVVSPRMPVQAVDALRSCDRIASMRLHAQILGLKLGRPTLAIEYDPKMARASEMAEAPASARLAPSSPVDAWRHALAALVSAEAPTAAPGRVRELGQAALEHKRVLNAAIDSVRGGRTSRHWRSAEFDWMQTWAAGAMHRVFARRENSLAAQAARSEARLASLRETFDAAGSAANSEVMAERAKTRDLELRQGELQEALRQESELHTNARGMVAQQAEAISRQAELIALQEGVVDALKAELDDRARAIDAMQAEISAYKAEVQSLAQDVSRLRAENAGLSCKNGELVAQLSGIEKEFDAVTTSRSWRLTLPLRIARTLAVAPGQERRRVLSGISRSVFWSMPEPLRHALGPVRRRLGGGRAQQAAPGLDCSDASLDWVALANSSAKVAIVPCAFEFDELVNQRPINLAKYLAGKGCTVIFAAWQWSRGERLAKSNREVYPGVWQVDLYDLIDRVADLERRKDSDSAYFLTLPAPELVGLHQAMRKAGLVVVYDILDDWEAFHGVGQAPWYSSAHEHEAVMVADAVAAVSPPLVAKFRHLRSDLHVVGNGYTPATLGVDNKFRAARTDAGDGKVRIGYFGHLTDAWFDWNVVLDAARSLPGFRFEMIGYGEPQWVRDAAAELPNLVLVGKVAPGELWKHAQHWHAGLAPFKPGTLAVAIDPIKVYEYIYLGLPTICTGIPHLAALPGVAVVEGSEAFVAACRDKAATRPDYEAMERCLQDTTWEARFDALTKLAAAAGLREAYVS